MKSFKLGITLRHSTRRFVSYLRFSWRIPPKAVDVKALSHVILTFSF